MRGVVVFLIALALSSACNAQVASTGSFTGGIGVESYVPLMSADFEQYSIGENISNITEINAFSRSALEACPGGRSGVCLKVAIEPEDGGGFGDWGYEYTFDPDLVKDQEIWWKTDVYFPSTFSFTADPWMKVMRIHCNEVPSANCGYLDLYIENETNGGGSDVTYRTIQEFDGHGWATTTTPNVVTDDWMTLEMYAYIDDESTDDGGSARVRIWIDGDLIFDRTDNSTIIGPTDVINLLFYHTFWNGSPTPSNESWVDNIVVATSDDPPTNTDAGGNPFIGTQ